MIDLKGIIEAILFVSPRPLSIKLLRKKIGEYDEEVIEGALQQLRSEYNNNGKAIEVVEVSRGYQMRTKLEYKPWVARFVKAREMRLTHAMLEALAIVAYKQPITKREIDGIRGVDSSRVVKQLLELKLIEIAGRNDDIGKPIVFRTTKHFLDVYGLKRLDELPTLKEFESLEE